MNLTSEKKKIDSKIESDSKDFNVQFFKEDNPSVEKIELLVKYAQSKGYKCIKSVGFGYPVGFRAYKTKIVGDADKQVCESYFGDYKCHVATNIKDSKGNVVFVDKCLKETIENLNEKGFKTVASCCGHGIINPDISLDIQQKLNNL